MTKYEIGLRKVPRCDTAQRPEEYQCPATDRYNERLPGASPSRLTRPLTTTTTTAVVVRNRKESSQTWLQFRPSLVMRILQSSALYNISVQGFWHAFPYWSM